MTNLVDVSPKPELPERYLGDAVYASFDGFQLALRCASPPCVIYLEPAVYHALTEYVEMVRKHNADRVQG